MKRLCDISLKAWCAGLFWLLCCGVAEARDDVGALTWFDGSRPVTYRLPKGCSPVLTVAAGMFRDDLRQVTGMEPVESAKATIVVTEGHGQRDGFSIRVSGNRIMVHGDTPRGAAYGLLELSRMAGVSPWVWWGDVVPQKKNRLTIDRRFKTRQTCSVEYRGIFINDEDWSLRPWATQTHEPTGVKGRIGPKTYRRIFELLLRLRANTLWPAMHEGTEAFFQTPGARQMADSCGIVIGTSHCEPMLRNNVGEWDVNTRGRFNYMTNREAVKQYWRERLVEARHGDYLYTLGMRGIHDGSMEGVSTLQEKTEALQQVIDDQREMLADIHGKKTVERLPQVFVPYKEVLQIMENGLRVPDDVALMWCDDNYGYLTRLSTPREQMRKGGAGVYYHLSYWGRPHDHLWLTTTQPGLIYSELRNAYDHNVRRIWIANVHDPKVAAYDLQLFLDMAWDINSVSPSTLRQHLENWLTTQFGEKTARAITPAMVEYYRLCAVRKPEFMGWTQVELDKRRYERGLSPVDSVEMTAGEAARRIRAFEDIARQVEHPDAMPVPELLDAYFAAVLYPVRAALDMTRKIVGDSVTSLQAYKEIQSMTTVYNNQIADGKWNGLMDAHPRRLPVFDNVRARVAADDTLHRPRMVRNASHYDRASMPLQPVEMLGHTSRALPLPKGASVEYVMEATQAGLATLFLALIPTQPDDGNDVRFSVQIDDGDTVVFSLKEPFRSEGWKKNVLRGQAVKQMPVSLEKGRHVLTLKAIDDHVVLDQWMLDYNTQRKFYEFY